MQSHGVSDRRTYINLRCRNEVFKNGQRQCFEMRVHGMSLRCPHCLPKFMNIRVHGKTCSSNGKELNTKTQIFYSPQGRNVGTPGNDGLIFNSTYNIFK